MKRETSFSLGRPDRHTDKNIWHVWPEKKELYPWTGMLRTLLRLVKILSTTSGSLLEPNSVAIMDCWMSAIDRNTDWTPKKKPCWDHQHSVVAVQMEDLSAGKPAEALRCRMLPCPFWLCTSCPPGSCRPHQTPSEAKRCCCCDWAFNAVKYAFFIAKFWMI